MIDLTADEARRIILRAQGLLGADARRGGPHAMLRRLGAIQLDTISVLARSHELVAYARLGAVGRSAVERAYWHEPAQSFEYWCHAACILPIEHWPLYAFRRRAFRDRRYRWHEVPDHVDTLLRQVRDSGPLTTSDVGGAKNGGPWWDWSDSKIGLEWLLDIGEIVCSRRVGWRRVYDLAERVVPADLLAEDLSDEECIVRLAAIAGRSLGVATRGDLIDFLRLKGRFATLLDEALLSGASGLVPVRVAGWPTPRGATSKAPATTGRKANGRQADDLRTDGLGDTGLGGDSLGDTGLGGDSLGADGPGSAEPVAVSSTVKGPEAYGPGLNGPGAYGSGANGPEANGPGANRSGANGPGTEGAEAEQLRAEGPGAKGLTGGGSRVGTLANAWADPAALESEPRGRHRTAMVSPFDSLIWHRGRTERVFGFSYQLELYVPKHKRVHGYFTMPVLAGGRLIGRVDPARDGTTLVARQLSLEPGLSGAKWGDAMRDALWAAAEWVGCDAVRIERADPALAAHLTTPL